MLMYMAMALTLMLVVLHLLLFKVVYHYLSSLLVLEGMVLMAILIIVATMGMVGGSLSLYLFILTLSVVEASLGLTLLLSYVKASGSDLIRNSWA
uniref:NADH dehydrogenase subunit 4L n=1 Tax=Zaptyx kikaiensis TaxID=1885889 RepID=A0A224AC55_9EUPU|nr:NADH dehydrogenase subunit 4L [Zaptyx kikaiensis]